MCHIISEQGITSYLFTKEVNLFSQLSEVVRQEVLVTSLFLALAYEGR